MKRKFDPGISSRINAPRRKAVEGEKEVSSFFAKVFYVALAAFVAVFLLLWAMGKFG